jgi:hypothetical protein
LGHVLWPAMLWIHPHANFWISWLHEDKLGKRIQKQEKNYMRSCMLLITIRECF